MSDFLSIHLFFISLLGLFELVYLFLSQYFKDAHSYIFRIRVFLPAYYSMYAFSFFTGILIEALKGFSSFNITMLIAWILMLGLSIYEFVVFKKSRKSQQYFVFRKKALIIELIKIIIFIFAGAKSVLLF